MLKRIPWIIIFCSVFLLNFAGICAGAEGDLVDTVKFTGGDHLIYTFIVVADNEAVHYTIIGGCDEGLEKIEITAGEKILFSQPCGKKQTCRITSSIPTATLNTQIFTAAATCASGKTQKEKIKINPEGKNPKVYLIASLPYYTGGISPLIASSTDESTATSTTTIPDSATSTVVIPAPSLNVEVQQEQKNSYHLTITVEDPAGIDFIEIMRNKVYLDVQLCKGKTRCAFEKTITEEEKGEVNYLIKTMNLRGALSFEEKNLSFE